MGSIRQAGFGKYQQKDGTEVPFLVCMRERTHEIVPDALLKQCRIELNWATHPMLRSLTVFEARYQGCVRNIEHGQALHDDYSVSGQVVVEAQTSFEGMLKKSKMWVLFTHFDGEPTATNLYIGEHGEVLEVEHVKFDPVRDAIIAPKRVH